MANGIPWWQNVRGRSGMAGAPSLADVATPIRRQYMRRELDTAPSLADFATPLKKKYIKRRRKGPYTAGEPFGGYIPTTDDTNWR